MERIIKINILLNSFLILFLELALIRFLPSQISYLGYYSNFILLASFVGMGAGILLAKNKRNFFYCLPSMLFILMALSVFFPVSVRPNAKGEMRFMGAEQGFAVPDTILIPVVFFFVVLVFTFLSQNLGRLLNNLPPLKAYTWDITGSLAGIALFGLASYFYLTPVLWFGLFSLGFLWLYRKESIRWWWISFGIFLVLTVILTPTAQGARWSPYQKVTVEPIVQDGQKNGYLLMVNNITHQSFMKNIDDKDQMFYSVPYQLFKNTRFKHALVVGAGTGNDVAAAIRHQVGKVDAVEIDPQILRYGKELHPNKPYQNANVTAYVTDARSFLEKTSTQYDLIVYALPDSLILASSHGNIRLESFLFTEEAFKAAKRRLTSDGAFVLYNFYRSPWLVAKLNGLLETVFKRQPYVLLRGGGAWWPVVLVSGGRLDDLRSDIRPSATFTKPYPKNSTDDWPFLYLLKPSLPWHYLWMLMGIGVVVYLILSLAAGKKLLHRQLEFDYFFMGAAFLLLETKSVIQFSLLFGSTWLVNALVFFAILTLVLLAALWVSRVQMRHFWLWYLALGVSLVIQYIFQLENLLGLPPIMRYILVSLLMFTPIFLANVIFSNTFKNSSLSSRSFASNILGAAVGAMLEYFALLCGYRNLTWFVCACYLLALIIQYRKRPMLLK